MTYPPAEQQPHNRWLAYALGGGGILAIALFVVLRLTLGGSSADTVVDKAVTAINNKDAAQAKELSCDNSSAGMSGSIAGVNVSIAVNRNGDVTENGDTAQAPITVKFTAKILGNTISRSAQSAMKLHKRDGDWCVDDLSDPLGIGGK